ncbi:MAG: DNA mismatch repair endonuclease MutL [Desulfobacterales bacterium]|nr:DNA mismatch repair endonuclease MutL [Desulfobacterales bacterium]
MSKVKKLPEILSNKIAAGEVVERPASVVKELLENSIDAESSRIIIDLEKGGRELIRISDNGFGMSSNDALLAVERYATSKIYDDSDLFAIKTLGFRGEALPSIAAVSLFTIITREKDSEFGSEINIQGGKISKVGDIGAPFGTMISVKDLFYNIPARRKFLKTIETEMGHIVDLVSALALCYPDIHFKLNHNDKNIKNFPKSFEHFDRVIDVLGSEIKDELYPVHLEDGFLKISGWISSHRITRSTSKNIYLYVNGRCIRDKIIMHALLDGYEGFLMKGQYPVAVLLIDIPFSDVDVNVHPTKYEVRFAKQQFVHQTVKKCVAKALTSSNKPKISIPDSVPANPHVKENNVSEELPFYKIEKEDEYEKPYINIKQGELWEEKEFSSFKVIGQLQNTYILCESNDGLIIIDQHAAHERILFEKLKNKASKIEVQRLLIPETIELGYREVFALQTLIPYIESFGLEIEFFGGNTFIVKAVPYLLIGKEVKPLLLDLIDKVIEIDISINFDKVIDECLILMACHSAIRANQSLSHEQMKSILSDLDKIQLNSNCPHGRPIWIKWNKLFLEKSFGRKI